jgi:hypothetical protein
VPDDEEEDEEPEPYQPQGSPVRIAMPVGRSAQPIEPAEQLPPRAVPASLAQAADEHQDPEPEEQIASQDDSRLAAQEAAASTFGNAEDPRGQGSSGGKEAIAQYDYTKDEENELELTEGERIINIEMVDDDWWIGENSKGEKGLFPSNYVELVEGGAGGANNVGQAAAPQVEEPEETAPPPGPPQPSGGNGATATAEYDYEAAEPNELSFPDGAKIVNIVSSARSLLHLKLLLTSARNSLTRTGGMASSMVSPVSSRRTMSSWTIRDGKKIVSMDWNWTCSRQAM